MNKLLESVHSRKKNNDMEYIILSVLLSIFLPLAMGILLLFLIFKQRYSYWDKFDIAVKPPRIPYGSLGNPFTTTASIHEKLAEAYKSFKENNQKHGGIYIYQNPIYIPIDPAIIKSILIKDFNSFSEKNMYRNEKKDPLSANLLTVEGQEWKDMKNKLTPLFTTRKLKLMFPLLKAQTDRLVKVINDSVSKTKPVNINDVVRCFTIDSVGSFTLGLECNSLENSYSSFIIRKIGQKAFHLTPFRYLKGEFTRDFPNLARFLGIVTYSKAISDFFMDLINKSYDYRCNTNLKRDDLLQSLMDLEKDEVDESTKRCSIAAQALVFFNAGSETSSITTTFAIYELACNPEIQDKLRKEVTSVIQKHDGLTYEALMEMEYLSRVTDETLRKYPPTPTIIRRCVQDYHVEGTNLVIKKGIKIFLTILGIHKDPEYYPNPEVFDPERFNETNKNSRPSCTYLPFLHGPRSCIGQKLGLMQVKVGLAVILSNFKFSLHSKTAKLVFDTRSFKHRCSSEIYIDFEKI